MFATKNLQTAIIEQLKTQTLVRIPATEEEFLSVAQQIPFKIEYFDSEIITSGLTSYWHEVLVMTIGGILYNLYQNKAEEFTVLGSNAGVLIPKFEGDYYLPDVLVVKGEPIFKPNSTAIITNPYLVIEILSPATATYDQGAKSAAYKHLPSLQQIILVEQKCPGISSYLRADQPNIWINQDFYNLEEEILIDGIPVVLRDIYRKVKFEG